MAGKKASTTAQPQLWGTAKDESVGWMMRAATKRARMARAMVMAMRVAGKEEGEGGMGHGIGNEGGVRQRWQ